MIMVQTKNYSDDELDMSISIFAQAVSKVERSNMRTLHDDLYRTLNYLEEASLDRDRVKYEYQFDESWCDMFDEFIGDSGK